MSVSYANFELNEMEIPMEINYAEIRDIVELEVENELGRKMTEMERWIARFAATMGALNLAETADL